MPTPVTKTFLDHTTVISAAWLNWVDYVVNNTTVGGGGETTSHVSPFAAVDYLLTKYHEPSSGFVDLTAEDFTYVVPPTAGASFVCQYTTVLLDAGIWVLGDVTNPAAVPVTRRADCPVGTSFNSSWITPLTNGPFFAAGFGLQLVPWGPDYDATVPTGVIGTDWTEGALATIPDPYYGARQLVGESVAFGQSSAAMSLSVAVGAFALAYYRSVVVGHTAKAVGTDSVVIGSLAKVTADYSVAIGAGAEATAQRTVALGFGAVANATGLVAIKGDNFKLDGLPTADPNVAGYLWNSAGKVTLSGAGPLTADTQDFYVSPTGDDANAGTEASPWKTLQHAFNMIGQMVKVAYGAILHVADGNYPERTGPSDVGAATTDWYGLQIRGNTATPGAVTIDYLSFQGGLTYVEGVSCFDIANYVGYLELYACHADSVSSYYGGYVSAWNHTVTGRGPGGRTPLVAEQGAVLDVGGVPLVLSGTPPSYPISLVTASTGGYVSIQSAVSGTITGYSYVVNTGGSIDAPNGLPGDGAHPGYCGSGGRFNSTYYGAGEDTLTIAHDGNGGVTVRGNGSGGVSVEATGDGGVAISGSGNSNVDLLRMTAGAVLKSSVKLGVTGVIIHNNTSGDKIELLDTGGIKVTGLPTADPHVVGQLWNNAGTLKVSAG